ncbi:MAG TPA: hypothetical protein VMZ53_19975, partial [Kofleriaceae bacterium]|nr:hypothetical protein [Kofleriaceae bacterium]
DLDIDSADRVAGDYHHYDMGLVFDFRRDPSVEQHYFILETEQGKHLMTVATAGGWRFLNVLDGSFTSAGPIDGEQKTSGDPAALSIVFEVEEMKLLEPLRLALTAHGIDDDLQQMPLSNIDTTQQELWMPGMRPMM